MSEVELISTSEAAAILGVHTNTVRNYVRYGELRPVQVAHRTKLRFRAEDVRALLEPK
jgi:excisionase family DNA binding protein